MNHHKNFVEQYKLGKATVFFDVEKIKDVAINYTQNDELKNASSKMKKMKKSQKWILGFGIVSLFTPFKLFILLSILFCATSYVFEKVTKKLIINEMLVNEEFYNKMIDDSVVKIGLFAEDNY